MHRSGIKTNGSIVGDIVFAAHDGIITTFAIVAGVAGASLPHAVVLILGLANLFADGISMAVGDYLGRESEKEVDELQRQPSPVIVPSRNALAVFVAFVIAGALPLIPYFAGARQQAFLIALLCTAGGLFFIGSLRSLVSKRQWWSGGIEVLFIGAMAALAAYSIGYFLRSMVA